MAEGNSNFQLLGLKTDTPSSPVSHVISCQQILTSKYVTNGITFHCPLAKVTVTSQQEDWHLSFGSINLILIQKPEIQLRLKMALPPSSGPGSPLLLPFVCGHSHVWSLFRGLYQLFPCPGPRKLFFQTLAWSVPHVTYVSLGMSLWRIFPDLSSPATHMLLASLHCPIASAPAKHRCSHDTRMLLISPRHLVCISCRLSNGGACHRERTPRTH